MTILDQLTTLIVEGAADAHHRMLARDAFRDISKALKSGRPVRWIRQPGPHAALSVNVGELLGAPELENLTLTFANTPGKPNAVLRTKGSHKADIVLDVKVHDRKTGKLHGDIPIERWEPSVKKLSAEMLERKKDEFIHEFIHFLDWIRIGDRAPGVIRKTDRSTPGGYYNSPLEQNAFIQQGLSAIESYLDGKDAKEIKSIIGSSSTEFLQIVMKVLPKEFTTHMNADTKRRLAKRVAQAYNDITNKERER